MTGEHADAVPITVISGPLGAGKTTLVNRILDDPGDRRIAVIVNDMAEVNIDAESLTDGGAEDIVDLSNGCICCRLQNDLVTEVTRLDEERSFDYLVIEASGLSEPIPIARALTVGSGETSIPDRFHLDTTVSVVDAYGFWKAFDPEASLPEAAPEPPRPVTELLVDQIEFCDILLLNKSDMIPDDHLDAVELSIRELQPRAVLYRTTYCDVDPGTVLGTGLFDFAEARRQQGWKQALAAAEHADETQMAEDHHHDPHDNHAPSPAATHGVDSFVYRREQPFHPERFDRWLDDWDGDILRLKGFAWVASRPETVLGVSQAGPAVQAGPIGDWGDDDPATRLVIIGRALDTDTITANLEACLASDTERARSHRDDPFPRESSLP